MKPLFKNYNFNFDKNEKKLLTNFCRQALTQFQSDPKFSQDTRAYNGIIDKLNSQAVEIKLTKEEARRLSFQIKENVKFLKDKSKKSWFIKKWIYNSLASQYDFLINKHFNDIN